MPRESLAAPVAEIEQDVAATKSTWGERLCRWLDRHERTSLAGVLLALFAAALLVSHVRRFWFDELFTMLVANQPTLHDFALAMPADANPPLLPFLVRGLSSILGPTELAGRLPSMLGYVAACAGVYVFVRRRMGVAAALLAPAILLSEPGMVYSFEARSYSLLLAFMVLTMVCWQRAAERERRRGLALLGMVLGIAGAMLTHHVGLVEAGLPILFGEAVRLSRRRRVDLPIAATFLVALPLLLLTLPMAHRTRQELLSYAPSYRAALSLHTLKYDWLWNASRSFFLIVDVASAVMLGLLIAAGWPVRPKQLWLQDRAERESGGPRSYEVAAAFGALLLIPVTMVLMMSTSGYYNCRYGIGSLAGLAILGCFGASKVFPARRDVLAALLAIFCILFVADVFRAVRGVRHNTLDRVNLLVHPELPLVVSDPTVFYPVWWYAPADQRDRLHYLTDREAARSSGTAVVERGLVLERDRFAAHIDPYGDFLTSHPHFLAYLPELPASSSLRQRLGHSGYRLTAVGAPEESLYEVERIRP